MPHSRIVDCLSLNVALVVAKTGIVDRIGVYAVEQTTTYVECRNAEF
jgi:hypothetical protein